MSSAPLVAVLTGAGLPGDVVGGKGAWLDRLLAEGFPVPATAVLTTACYRAVVRDPSLAALLDELATGPPTPVEQHEQAAHRVDEAFLDVRLPPPVTAAIAAAWEATADAGGCVAARSSATAEDLHGTSFAGQYRSLLGIGDRPDLERAARLVWASLWHPAPRAYRRFHRVDEGHMAMAVAVMRQVQAAAAGVAFTVDPGGAPGTVRVESVEGLGEQLVSGQVTPTVHLVPRAAHGAAPGSATRADPLAAQVAALAVEVEQALGEPQDLEWAIDAAGGLWLLQARPITTGGPPPDDDGFDSPDRDSRRWTSEGIVEMVPGVLPPLRWEVCRLALEEALRRHVAGQGPLPPEVVSGRPLLGRVQGRAVLDEALLDQIERATEGGGWRAALRRSRTAVRTRRRALWEAGTMTVAALELAGAEPDLACLTDEALLALRRRLVDGTVRAMTAEVAIAGAATAASGRLEADLRRHLDPDEARAWVGRVTARPGGTLAGWPGPALTSALQQATPRAVAAVAGAADWSEARQTLHDVPGGSDLLADIEAALHDAGSAAVVAGPTWQERPERLWPALQAMAEQAQADGEPSAPDPGAPTPLDDLLDGLAANPSWQQARWMTGQLVDVRRILLRRAAEDASDLLERRERAKSAVLTLGGCVRRTHLELGARLASRGLLEEPGDVELLGELELVAALRGRIEAVPTMAELARRRRWLAGCEQAGATGTRATPTLGAEADRSGATAPGVLSGLGASPGRLTGLARVLERSDAGGLHRGEVLVARSTDASWAPLFMVAGAVVVEEGGPLSHAAIVARELGIPAVLAVPGVVEHLAGDPRLVTVDGDHGTVQLLPARPADARHSRPATTASGAP